MVSTPSGNATPTALLGGCLGYRCYGLLSDSDLCQSLILRG